MKKKIILTRRWPEAVEKLLAERYDCDFNTDDIPFTRNQYQEALSGCDAILTTVTDTLDASVAAVESPRTQIIANYGVGYSHINLDVVAAKNIAVTNTPDVLSECTADLAMTLLLSAARRAGEGEREVRSRSWTGWRPTHMIGSRVTGKTLGIVGFGRIGREMAKRARFGFDMDIKVFNRSVVAADVLSQFDAVQLGSIEELMAASDFVSLHCPGGEENTHLINEARLAAMKATGILINTARGEVVDEDALINALSRRQIAGAGLDVFQNEPALDTRFLDLENAVLLPHLGSSTTETRVAMGLRVAKNLEQFFAGEEPADRVV